jgi:hypothetical protein
VCGQGMWAEYLASSVPARSIFPENGGPSKRAGLILRRKGIVQAYFYHIPETE